MKYSDIADLSIDHVLGTKVQFKNPCTGRWKTGFIKRVSFDYLQVINNRDVIATVTYNEVRPNPRLFVNTATFTDIKAFATDGWEFDHWQESRVESKSDIKSALLNQEEITVSIIGSAKKAINVFLVAHFKRAGAQPVVVTDPIAPPVVVTGQPTKADALKALEVLSDYIRNS
jgi:hypothetical protein